MPPFSLKQLFHVLSMENMSEGGGGGSLPPDWDLFSLFSILVIVKGVEELYVSLCLVLLSSSG